MTDGPTTPDDPYSTGALTKDSPTERTRLESIQSSTDAFSLDILTGLGLAPDWECLELGAGAGSIAYALAERCPRGRVVAVDVDTRYLDAGKAPNLEVVQADITDSDYAPGQFDLVHARFVFCHLAARDDLVARATRWLKPGGWLVVTDPYQLPADTSPFPAVRRLMAAYQDVYATHGADLTWARQIPSLLARNGLSSIDFVGRLGCMGNLARDRWQPLVNQVAPAMLESGAVSQADIDEFRERLNDPTFIDIPQFILTAWGRLPSTGQ
ncbi:methyltransferase [Longimycelium tulufanense]|uniref:Methyltransferase n=1 Tax=Longimycelium tulufanense TaxID=907463 RepID=A0A8J3CA94_9PSEU|nr:class I SAM-dependent methyltransferase [Longimycelium tulufanense]GGM49538.1 methyltransferase [Longimycelium tulufanense]